MVLSAKFFKNELQIKTPDGLINHPFDVFSSDIKRTLLSNYVEHSASFAVLLSAN